MKITTDIIRFDRCDMPFVQTFGLEDATAMVLDYKNSHACPFIYDTYQLANCLGLRRKTLFYLARHADDFYRAVPLKKRSGGTRTLHIPDLVLLPVLKAINRSILQTMPASRYATAYKKGATVANNARAHIGKRYVLKLDITDFFGSINAHMVYSAVFNTTNFPKHIGALLTNLCCYKDRLPQGSPTSPALSNLVMRRFDENLGRWCARQGIAYTRYCDDMTFSADIPLGKVYHHVKAMLDNTPFELNERKTVFLSAAQRQSVTGLTVNRALTVNKDYKRALRQELHYVLRFGPADAILRGGRKNFIKNAAPQSDAYLNHLIGKTAYVLQIEPTNAWFRQALFDLQHL